MLNNSVVSRGNTARIKALMKRALAGGKSTIVTIGGSITEGASAEKGKEYGNLVMQWWKDKFPNSEINFINSGIGATRSLYGVCRAWRDVLCYNPDFVIIELAVNDIGCGEMAKECFESLIKRLLEFSEKIGIMLLFMCNSDLVNDQENETKIGDYYSLPMASFKNALEYDYSKNSGGEADYIKNKYIPDGTHPNNRGHRLAADVIIYQLQDIYERMDEPEELLNIPQEPLTSLRYMEGKVIDNTNSPVIENKGFIKNDSLFYQMPKGFIAKEKGSKIKFCFDCAILVLALHRSVSQNAGVVSVTVDGSKTREIDSFFYCGWGDYCDFVHILNNNEKGLHYIEIEFLGKSPLAEFSENPEFSILGFLCA